MRSREAVVGPDTALGRRLGPVVVVAQPHFGLRALADVPVLLQPVPFYLHIRLRLLVGHQELVRAASRLPLCIKPANVTKRINAVELKQMAKK